MFRNPRRVAQSQEIDQQGYRWTEYYYQANPITSTSNFDAFAVGVNWELTDLMLQFILTNAHNMAEDAFITQTRNNFNTRDGNLFFGFNATLVLHFRKGDVKN